MIGFPLDDIWHRIFGQDVTLWGPTHLMMIGGANFSLFAVLMLEYEGATVPAGKRAGRWCSWSEKTVPSSDSCAICPAAGC